MVLVSGGLAKRKGDPSKVLPDELFNLTSQEVIKVLDLEHSLQRFQHVMARIGDHVWALGGRDSSNTAPSKIAEFDPTTSSWNELTQELQSTNTTELVVTPYPVASLDCVPQCHCGIANKKERIFGGSEAEVRITTSICQPKPSFFRLIPTPGLLRFFVTRILNLATSTASVAVCW